MKLGYNTGYWSAGPPAGVENVVAECDKLGFEPVSYTHLRAHETDS